jgi:uncharacterized protein
MSRRDDPHGDRFFALRTFRHDGTAVSTPIWLAGAGDRFYAYTPLLSGKVRRLTRDARIQLVRSDFDGEPRGEWQNGRARLTATAELMAIRHAMTAKYGHRFRLFMLMTFLGRRRRYGGPAAGLEITLDRPLLPGWRRG